MNKKARIGDIMMDNVIYLILLIIFFAGMFTFVNSKTGGASFWEDYYAKEITRVVDSSMPGDIIYLDVQKATEIAQGNKITNFEDMFKFNNLENEVCVKLSRGRASCFNYFNDVSVTFDDSGRFVHYAEPVNRLHIKIIEKRVLE